MKKIVFAAVAALAAVSLTACGSGAGGGFDKFNETFKDAPIGKRVNKPVTIIEMPDGYANVATVCVDGIRYSTTTNGGGQSEARAVSVTADPTCK
jgi:hypothetical protein